MITDFLFGAFNWIQQFIQKLDSFIITPGLSLLGLVISVSLISMLIKSLIGKGYE